MTDHNKEDKKEKRPYENRAAEHTHQMGTGAPYEDGNYPGENAATGSFPEKGPDNARLQQGLCHMRQANFAEDGRDYADGMYILPCDPAREEEAGANAAAFNELKDDIFPPLAKFTPNDPEKKKGRYQENDETVRKKLEEREEFRY